MSEQLASQEQAAVSDQRRNCDVVAAMASSRDRVRPDAIDVAVSRSRRSARPSKRRSRKNGAWAS